MCGGGGQCVGLHVGSVQHECVIDVIQTGPYEVERIRICSLVPRGEMLVNLSCDRWHRIQTRTFRTYASSGPGVVWPVGERVLPRCAEGLCDDFGGDRIGVGDEAASRRQPLSLSDVAGITQAGAEHDDVAEALRRCAPGESQGENEKNDAERTKITMHGEVSFFLGESGYGYNEMIRVSHESNIANSWSLRQ